MLTEILKVLKHALMITGFVFVMMLVIEYINVLTKGVWQNNISQNKWKQYLLAATLGAIPGCLGAFTAVALYSHRLISFGAVVTAMIATSGDEAFVMFAMFPLKALWLTLLIFVIGIIGGILADKIPFFSKSNNKFSENSFPIHTEEKTKFITKNFLSDNFRKPSIYRISLLFMIIGFLLSVGTGLLGGDGKLWVKITVITVVTFSLFVVVTVQEHFLKEHLWNHLVKVHLLRIFLWTFGTLLVVHYLMNYLDLTAFINNNIFLILIIAILVGIIPESGPHLIFVTLFAQGTIPFSILLASSISQDGHGMLPLLAESKKSFLYVKIVNMIIAALVGGAGLFFEY